MSDRIAVGGGVVARADGPELLVWTLEGLQPRWSWQGTSRLADVAIDGSRVWSLGADGRLVCLDALDGSVLLERTVPGPGRRVLAAGGHVVCLGVAGVAWLRGEHVVGEIAQAGIKDIGLTPDGTQAVALTSLGTLATIDLVNDESPRQVALEPGGERVHWSPQGLWLVAGETSCLPVSVGADQVAPAMLTGLAPAGDEVVCLHGAALARREGTRWVRLVALATGHSLGDVHVGLDVLGLAATDEQLLMGLPNGTVQMMDLVRTQRAAAAAHPGRAARPWAVDDGLDRAAARGALARLQVGGGAIATRNVITYEQGSPWWRPLVWVGGVTALLFALLLLAWALGVFG